MTLSEIRQIVANRGIQLTKSLGQNFLHDGNQLRKIAAAAELTPADKVLEIGPGLGPLTELLLAQASKVLAIETDVRLVGILRERFGADSILNSHNSKLDLLHADALAYLRREPRDWSGWKLVSNLPYSVASPILVELAQAGQGPERMVATLQSEVVRRLVASPGNGDYGVLTLLVQLRYEPRGSFSIPASCFFPEPDVASTCVTLVRRTAPLLPREQEAAFERIVKRAFSQRRKMMMKLLKQDWSGDVLGAGFDKFGLSRQVRAQDVGLDGFVQLTQWLAESRANGSHERGNL